jgi:hypothetical protein
MLRDLQNYAAKHGLAAATPHQFANRISDGCLLSHATTVFRMNGVAAARIIYSQREFARQSGNPPSSPTTETRLGTDNDVFFFLAPFRYPGTNCGLLFKRSLEDLHSEQGSATPFDSGGIVDSTKCRLQDATEPVLGFFERHQLTVPEHRSYLQLALSTLFAQPWDYIDGIDPQMPGPIGLTGGDARRWTHEVRIPVSVPVDQRHLQALFVPKGIVNRDPEIERLDEWCREQSIDTVYFNSPGLGEFDAMRNLSIEYLRGRLQ